MTEPITAERLPMPSTFVYNGFRFFFYSNIGSPREPIHVHGSKCGNQGEVVVAARRGGRGKCRVRRPVASDVDGSGRDAAGGDREGVA